MNKKRLLTDRGSPIQDLLDEEASIKCDSIENIEQREQLHTLIRLMRNETQRPQCFGEDDCSINTLVRCPWRIDCGG